MDNRISYTVKHKKIGDLFFKKIKGVEADGLIPENGSRYFLLSDMRRIEISTENTIFIFCKNRNLAIEKSMSKESGQNVKVH